MALLPLLTALLAAGPSADEAPASKQASRSDARSELAFVLLPKAELPSFEKIAAAFQELAPESEATLRREDSDEKVLSILFGKGRLLAFLMPRPVPNGEADDAYPRSLESLLHRDRKPPEHRAHLVLKFVEGPGGSPRDARVRFTQLVAAVAQASHATGVYWGAGGVTHDAEFFLKIARERDADVLPLLWCGFDLAREGPARVSLLTYGLREQLGLMDLRVTGRPERFGEVVALAADMVVYVAGRGADIPEGDTVGRDEDQRLKVRYEPSPVEPSVKVWRVDLP